MGVFLISYWAEWYFLSSRTVWVWSEDCVWRRQQGLSWAKSWLRVWRKFSLKTRLEPTPSRPLTWSAACWICLWRDKLPTRWSIAVIGTSRKTFADSHQTRSSCPRRLLCELCRSCDGYFFLPHVCGKFYQCNSCMSAISPLNITAGTRLGLKEQFTQNA